MAVNTAAAYGIYRQDAPLNDIVEHLNQAGFYNEDICIMLSPTHPIASMIRDASLFSSDREDSDASATMIGWLSAFGAVMIPTVGFFVRSRAFLRALMTAKDTPAVCGNARTLVGLGFSEHDAKRFEKQLARFGVLVYVACSESAKTAFAQEVLSHAGASEVSMLTDEVQVMPPAAVMEHTFRATA
jgi:hypothetical protein